MRTPERTFPTSRSTAKSPVPNTQSDIKKARRDAVTAALTSTLLFHIGLGAYKAPTELDSHSFPLGSRIAALRFALEGFARFHPFPGGADSACGPGKVPRGLPPENSPSPSGLPENGS